MSSVTTSLRKRRNTWHGFLLLWGLCGFLATESAMGQSPAADKNAENLMVVLRESVGANKQDEALRPIRKIRATLPDGREIDIEVAWFEFLGDMLIRFVFDRPSYMPNATPQDLARLNLSPEQALQLAVGNIKRVYGDPIAKPLAGGLMQVEGKLPDLDSSYFLDRAFWQGLLRQNPEGLVVAVTKRGSLLFTPITAGKAVDRLRNSVGYLYSISEHMRVSSALYLFKDDRWTVFQPPHAE